MERHGSRQSKSIHKSFDRVVRRLGLTVNGTKFRWHYLKHVFCNSLLKEGVSIDFIRELAGHRDRSTTDRYTSLERTEVGKYLSLIKKIELPDQRKAKAI
ncbi:site-specific integrase [Candidatus Latescibacterota bacterium]